MSDHEKLKHPQTMEEFNAILSEAGDHLVAVDFYTTWCPPCKHIGPIFATMAEEEGNANGKSILTFSGVREGRHRAMRRNKV